MSAIATSFALGAAAMLRAVHLADPPGAEQPETHHCVILPCME